jgi:anti-sigma B factor antagonist
MSESITEPTVLKLEGELEIAGTDEVRRVLADAMGSGGTKLVVDLSEISFIDSSGLGAVVEAHDRMRREGRPLTVVAPRGTAASVVLGLTGLRTRLPVFETLRGALEA